MIGMVKVKEEEDERHRERKKKKVGWVVTFTFDSPY